MMFLCATHYRGGRGTRLILLASCSNGCLSNVDLLQQVAALEDTLHCMLAQPVTHSSRRSPLSSSTRAIRAQLTALQQERSNHHVTVKGGQICR